MFWDLIGGLRVLRFCCFGRKGLMAIRYLCGVRVRDGVRVRVCWRPGARCKRSVVVWMFVVLLQNKCGCVCVCVCVCV
jgi:hypothetical protein